MAANDPKPTETTDSRTREGAMRKGHQAGGVEVDGSGEGGSGEGGSGVGGAREGRARDAPSGETSAERSDRLYADYRAAMLFFGETPGPQAKPSKDQSSS